MTPEGEHRLRLVRNEKMHQWKHSKLLVDNIETAVQKRVGVFPIFESLIEWNGWNMYKTKNSANFIKFWLDLAKRGMRDGRHELSAYTTLQTCSCSLGGFVFKCHTYCSWWVILPSCSTVITFRFWYSRTSDINIDNMSYSNGFSM